MRCPAYFKTGGGHGIVPSSTAKKKKASGPPPKGRPIVYSDELIAEVKWHLERNSVIAVARQFNLAINYVRALQDGRLRASIEAKAPSAQGSRS